MWPWFPQTKKRIWNESLSPSHHHTSVAVCPAALWFVLFLFVCTRVYIPLIQPGKKKSLERKTTLPYCPKKVLCTSVRIALFIFPSFLFIPSTQVLAPTNNTASPRLALRLPVFMIADPYWSTSKHCTRPPSPAIHISVCADSNLLEIDLSKYKNWRTSVVKWKRFAPVEWRAQFVFLVRRAFTINKYINKVPLN